MAGRSQSPLEELPFVEGAATGTVAYVVGMILTTLLLTLDRGFEFGDSGFGSVPLLEVGRLDLTAWIFYGAHFASVESTARAFGETRTLGTNVVSSASTGFPAAAYHLTPMVVLTVAGFFVASVLEGLDPSPADYAQAGATVFAGYLPLAVAGTFFFQVRLSGAGQSGVTIGPALLPSVVLVGFVFPLVFGGVGGLVFGRRG